MRCLLIALGLFAQGSGFPPIDVSSLAVAPPMRIAELDMKTLKGQPRRLSWSPDGTALYLQTIDGLGPNAQVSHYSISVAGGEPRKLAQEPDWAITYWAYKVGESAPGFPDLKIEVHVDQQKTRVVPFAGGFVNGGAPSGTEAASTLTLARLTLVLQDVEIGQWMNDEPKSGTTFGWGPWGSGALVFVDKAGRIALLDKERRLRTLTASGHPVLPAWSGDGGYISFLQKSARNHYELFSIALARAHAALQQ